MTIRTISEELKNRYGGKVLKLSLSSGCSCPNRDGRAGYGGCSFCSEGGSGEFASDYAPLEEQIREAKKRVDQKFPKDLPEGFFLSAVNAAHSSLPARICIPVNTAALLFSF